MILDFVKDKNNFISVSYFDEINFNSNDGLYCPKPNVDWKIKKNLDKAIIQLNSVESFYFKSIKYQKNGNAKAILEYSSDGLTWAEFPYKWYNNYFYKYVSSYAIYYLIDPSKNDIEKNRIYLTKDDSDLFTNDPNFLYRYLTPDEKNSYSESIVFDIYIKFFDFLKPNSFELIDEKQQVKFVRDNPNYSNELNAMKLFSYYPFNIDIADENSISIYHNLYVKHVRIRFENITASYEYPFNLYQFQVFGDEEYETNENQVSLRCDDFFHHKFFETNRFVPSVVQSFCDMLDDSTNETNYLNPDFLLHVRELLTGVGYDPIGETPIQ